MTGEPRFVYDFDESAPGGRELLGGKGIGLAEMTALGLPVPSGFTITTDACRAYMAAGDLPAGLADEVADHVRRLEEKTGKRFGDHADPLLVSVRSGAAISMPGMMDTILNLGLNDEAAEGLADRTGNRRFAYDSYRRLIQMFGEVVDGIDGHRFEDASTELKRERGVSLDTDLTADDLAELVETYRGDLPRGEGHRLPAGRDRAADARRARRVRLVGHAARAGVPPRQRHPGRHRHRGQRRADGVRQQGRPLGHRRRVHAQPVDRREGDLRRVPRERAGRGRRRRHPDAAAGRGARPRRCPRRTTSCSRPCTGSRRTTATCRTRSSPSRTASSTCCRRAPRSARRPRRCKAAVDMVDEGLITQEEAVLRIDPNQLDQLLHPRSTPTWRPSRSRRA